jgi:carbonic anhydrase
MPVCTSIERKYPAKNEYDAPKKYVLVLSCVDYRLLDDLIRFLDHDNLTNRYYHVALAGAALGVVPNEGVPLPPTIAVPHWRETFLAHVRATILLTEGKLSDIYIVQHQDCGAFKLAFDGFEDLDEEVQKQHNKQYANALLEDIKNTFCTVYNPDGDKKKGNPDGKVQKLIPAVHTFYMDLRGNVELFGTWPTVDDKKKGAKIECPNYVCQCPKPKKATTETNGASAEGPINLLAVAPIEEPRVDPKAKKKKPRQ